MDRRTRTTYWMALATVALVGMSLTASSLAQTTQPDAPSDQAEFRPAVEPAKTGAEAAPAGEKAEPGKGEEGKEPPAAKPKGPFGDIQLILLMVGGLALFYIWSIRGRKKQETKRKQMLDSLKKGDKVTSIGGVIGTVIEIKEDEVTVKVDETNNVRMRFARWAIRGVGETSKAENLQQQDQQKK